MADGNGLVFGTRDTSQTIRQRLEAFALSESADPWTRTILSECFSRWHQWNQEHFDGELVPPLILIAEPTTPQTYGDFSTVSGFGCSGQIRIRPSLVDGTHPIYGARASRDKRMRFALDVLLHEMIHQWQHETEHEEAKGYSGHGPTFRDKANQIGASLGLGQVRTCKRRGKDKDLPPCSQWPHNVRPQGYYGELRTEVPIEELASRASRALKAVMTRTGPSDVLLDAVTDLEVLAVGSPDN